MRNGILEGEKHGPDRIPDKDPAWKGRRQKRQTARDREQGTAVAWGGLGTGSRTLSWQWKCIKWAMDTGAQVHRAAEGHQITHIGRVNLLYDV